MRCSSRELRRGTRACRAAPLLATLLAALPGAAALAQDAPPRITGLEVYDEPTSRAVFAAADRNGDDRLSILEVGQAFEGLGTPRAAEPFRRLDVDRDGYLEWPEFDVRFRDLVDHGGSLRVRIRFGLPARSQESARPLAEQAMSLLDANKDAKLAGKELELLVNVPQLPGSVAAILREFDRDGSGDLSVEEMVPLAARLPAQPPPEAPRQEGGGMLPRALAPQDRDRNGVLDAGELGNLLARFDPSLVRWRDRILRDADQNGSGALGPVEIMRATAPR